MAKRNELWFLFVERSYIKAVKNPRQYDARTDTVVRFTVSGPFENQKQAQSAANKTTATPTCLSVLILTLSELESFYKSGHGGANNLMIGRVIDTFKLRVLTDSSESEEEELSS